MNTYKRSFKGGRPIQGTSNRKREIAGVGWGGRRRRGEGGERDRKGKVKRKLDISNAEQSRHFSSCTAVSSVIIWLGDPNMPAFSNKLL